MALAALLVLILIANICVGWRSGPRASLFQYHKLDAEMDALHRAMTRETSDKTPPRSA